MFPEDAASREVVPKYVAGLRSLGTQHRRWVLTFCNGKVTPLRPTMPNRHGEPKIGLRGVFAVHNGERKGTRLWTLTFGVSLCYQSTSSKNLLEIKEMQPPRHADEVTEVTGLACRRVHWESSAELSGRAAPTTGGCGLETRGQRDAQSGFQFRLILANLNLKMDTHFDS